MVLLSSGVWTEKHENQFQYADMAVIEGVYSDQNEQDVEKLFAHMKGTEKLPLFTGKMEVLDGVPQSGYTFFHARSVAENVKVLINGTPFNGAIDFRDGKPAQVAGLVFTGKSLIHSAPLTTIAFTRSWFGIYGSYIVAIGLLLFAFSTAISWSYYGDRAVTYIFGVKGILWYRLAYVVGFFFASFTDTTIVWTFSGIAIALMTIPNLFGILFLHKEMKSEVKLFWQEYANRFPDEKVPD
jgi:AGCS family alanine or glycine:cation symporter